MERLNEMNRVAGRVSGSAPWEVEHSAPEHRAEGAPERDDSVPLTQQFIPVQLNEKKAGATLNARRWSCVVVSVKNDVLSWEQTHCKVLRTAVQDIRIAGSQYVTNRFGIVCTAVTCLNDLKVAVL